MKNDKPLRCVDPVMKYCPACPYAILHLGDDFDKFLDVGFFYSCCMYGFDKGRPEDEPTEEELKEYENWCKSWERS